MKFGIIGFGRMGKMYYDVLSTLKIEVKFVCDIHRPENDIPFFQDYKEAIVQSKVDGIIIATYGPSHHEIVKYAIDEGVKYIVCEKPFTTSIKHADEIINKLKISNTRLTINYSRRFSEMYTELSKELFEKSIIGNPTSIIITSGAGGLATIGTHFFDLCSYILRSNIKSIYAVQVNKNLPNPRGKEFEDPGGYVLITFENNSRAYLDLGDDLGLQHFIEIIGEYGRVFIDETNENILIRVRSSEDRMKPKHLYGLPNPIIKNESIKMESMKDLIKKMINNLTSESELIVTPEIAKKSVEIYSAIRKSFDLKQPVSLPITDMYYSKEFMVT